VNHETHAKNNITSDRRWTARGGDGMFHRQSSTLGTGGAGGLQHASRSGSHCDHGGGAHLFLQGVRHGRSWGGRKRVRVQLMPARPADGADPDISACGSRKRMSRPVLTRARALDLDRDRIGRSRLRLRSRARSRRGVRRWLPGIGGLNQFIETADVADERRYQATDRSEALFWSCLYLRPLRYLRFNSDPFLNALAYFRRSVSFRRIGSPTSCASL
jgi:hypothetical protein